jgi:hypothetical protein
MSKAANGTKFWDHPRKPKITSDSGWEAGFWPGTEDRACLNGYSQTLQEAADQVSQPLHESSGFAGFVFYVFITLLHPVKLLVKFVHINIQTVKILHEIHYPLDIFLGKLDIKVGADLYDDAAYFFRISNLFFYNLRLYLINEFAGLVLAYFLAQLGASATSWLAVCLACSESLLPVAVSKALMIPVRAAVPDTSKGAVTTAWASFTPAVFKALAYMKGVTQLML